MKLSNSFKAAIRKGHKYPNRICAYIYKNGIAAYEHRQIKDGKQKVECEFQHVQNGEIKITTNRGAFDGRLVIHNASLILDGIESVEIYYGNTSESAKEKGIDCTTVTLFTSGGMEIGINIFNFFGSDITIQQTTDPNYSMEKQFINSKTIHHGEDKEAKP